MKPTRAVVPAFMVIVLLAACTGDEEGATGTTASRTTSPVPTPAATFTGAPGTGVYEYANEGLVVTVALDGNTGTLEVDNSSEHDLAAPDLYVLDAVDGHEIDGDVLASTPVGAGETSTFDVALDDITVDQIGLLVLLFGADNYGAFVRTG
jgi:hypothetical protein